MTRPCNCTDVLSVARGDASDDPAVHRHVQDCPECRRAIAEIRAIGTAARHALAAGDLGAMTSRDIARRAMAAGRNGLFHDLLVPAVAAAALVLIAAFLLGPSHEPLLPSASRSAPSPSGTAVAYRPVVLELGAFHAGTVPFLLHGPAGVERGSLQIPVTYVLETVPADPVVLDTF